MIVLIIHKYGVPSLESERQPPIAVYGDRPVACKLAREPVQPPSRQVHALLADSSVQRRQLQPQSFRVGRLDAGFASAAEEGFEPLVQERFDHK